MDRIWAEGAADGARQQRRCEFHRADQRPQSSRLSRGDFDRDGRQLPCDARGRQALDRGRPQRFGRQQSRDLGLDRLRLRRPVRDGQDRAARDDHVACGRVGTLRHPPQRNRARPFPDRERLGKAQPDSRRVVLRDARRHGASRALRSRCGSFKTSSSSCSPTPATISPARRSPSTAASILRDPAPSPTLPRSLTSNGVAAREADPALDPARQSATRGRRLNGTKR